jgi:hypothetical protein
MPLIKNAKGSWGGLPDFGITEAIQKAVAPKKALSSNNGSNLFGSSLAKQASKPQVLGSQTKNAINGAVPSPTQNTGGGGGSYYASAPSQAPQPSYSGEPGGGGDSGGDAGYDYLGALRSAFGQSRSSLESIIPTYDADYSNFKNLVEGGVTRAKDTLSTQNAEDERIFGEDLRRTLQTDKELRQRRQGVFSGLNALDSSAYQDDVTKADQALQQDTQSLDAEKRRTYDARQKEFAAYEQEATGKLASYANEISRAKAALQQSIASVNMEEAASIQNYIDKISSEAQQLNSQREAMALNLAQLQAQGTDVVGNLSKLNMSGFSNLFGQNLANRYQKAISRYSLPSGQVAGAGYIGNSKDEEQRRLLGL